jgi:hypothetical protein
MVISLGRLRILAICFRLPHRTKRLHLSAGFPVRVLKAGNYHRFTAIQIWKEIENAKRTL